MPNGVASPPTRSLRERLTPRSVVARYAVGLTAVAIAFVIRLALMPVTGTGAPFVLFFAATLITALAAGVGPALLALLVSLPLGAIVFVLHAGYSAAQATAQASLFALDGAIILYLTMLMTRRRKHLEVANAQLRESEERFRLTIEEAPIGMALVTLDGRFARVNRVLCDITGYAQAELTRLTFQQITHPDDLDTDLELLRRLERGEIPRYQLEKRYVRKDGDLVDILLSVSLLRAPDGAPRYYIVRIEDITARKRAEAALRLSEAKFSGIVSISSDAIISTDEHRRITLFNGGAERIFGYSSDEVLGAVLERLMPERFRVRHADHFAQFAAGDVASRIMGERHEIFGLRKDGEEFPAEASISKVTIGDETFFSVVLRDVTFRKQVEAALQAAVNARDAVLGVVAHDLRNPLNTIMMQASLLTRDGTEPERRDQKPRLVITRAATRMNRLIQDLLDVARVEAGELRVEQSRLSAADVVREAFEANAPLAAAAGLALHVEMGGDVGHIVGDRHRLLQVFDNLVGNAIKFTPRGGRVLIRASATPRSVMFAVADTGGGIAPDGLPHVFDPFWQATTRAGRLGAGLGLPITKGIVEAHGGRIGVESTVGEGTTFCFTIPAAPASEPSGSGRKPTDERRRHADRRRPRPQRS